MQATMEKPNFVELYPGTNTVEQMQEIAAYYSGKCLATEIVNNKTKIWWQCQCKNKWQASPTKIKSGTWCPKCAGKRSNANRTMTIQEMDKLAEKNGGKCLSIYYINNHSKLWFKCSKGHKFESSGKSLKKGHWCKKCSNKEAMKEKQLTITELQELAKERGGECLSKSIENAHEKLWWKCADGHKWDATAHSVKNSESWCPDCAKLGGIKEEKVRSIFEQLFEKEFKKTRKVLGKRYELDGYNEELNLAFEYHGEQHYYFIKGLHFTEERFEERKRKDREKEELCKSKGITLVPIPYWVSKTDETLITYIKVVLKGMNISFVDKEIEIKQDIYKAKLNKLKEIAEEKGGECLSNTYHGVKEKLKFTCKKGHFFEKTPDDVIHGNQWCAKCYGNNPYTIEEMQKIAILLGGECLSKEYVNGKTKMKWNCENGHESFERPFDYMRSKGIWCQQCKLDKQQVKEICKGIRNGSKIKDLNLQK